MWVEKEKEKEKEKEELESGFFKCVLHWRPSLDQGVLWGDKLKEEIWVVAGSLLPLEEEEEEEEVRRWFSRKFPFF